MALGHACLARDDDDEYVTCLTKYTLLAAVGQRKSWWELFLRVFPKGNKYGRPSVRISCSTTTLSTQLDKQQAAVSRASQPVNQLALLLPICATRIPSLYYYYSHPHFSSSPTKENTTVDCVQLNTLDFIRKHKLNRILSIISENKFNINNLHPIHSSLHMRARSTAPAAAVRTLTIPIRIR